MNGYAILLFHFSPLLLWHINSDNIYIVFKSMYIIKYFEND